MARVAERPISEWDDPELVQFVRGGDDRAFEELYERYRPRIAGFVRSMVKDHQRTEDVTQEVFLSALRRLRQTRAPIAFKPWLYEIARNACIDLHRRQKRAQEVPLGEELAEAAGHARPGLTPHAALDAKEQIGDLCDAFAGLSRTQHEMLVMREFEGRSYRDIGERLNLTRPAVESALFRARRRLTHEYQELVSGARCARVQRAIRSAPAGPEPVRDWRIAMHIARCPACRAHARERGLHFVGTPPRRAAALLPLPALLPQGVGGGWRERLASFWGGRWEWIERLSLSGGDSAIPGLVTAGAAAATVALALGSANVLGAHARPTHYATPVGTAAWPPRALSSPALQVATTTGAQRAGSVIGVLRPVPAGHHGARGDNPAFAHSVPGTATTLQNAATNSSSGSAGSSGSSTSSTGARGLPGGNQSSGAPTSAGARVSVPGVKPPSVSLPSGAPPATPHVPSVGSGGSSGAATPSLPSPPASGSTPTVVGSAPSISGVPSLPTLPSTQKQG
jgi:RNA polymerase sigma factor (sigma-70 family)